MLGRQPAAALGPLLIDRNSESVSDSDSWVATGRGGTGTLGPGHFIFLLVVKLLILLMASSGAIDPVMIMRIPTIMSGCCISVVLLWQVCRCYKLIFFNRRTEQ
jgi:hypothetical protein